MPAHARALAALSLLFTPALIVAQTPPRYVLTRDLRIDAAAANLSPVTWLAVSPSGTIAVGQQQDHLIRFFDAAGKALGTFGREGEGPGEFRGLDKFGVGWRGDSLWVGDYNLRRFAMITPERKLLRTVPAALTIKGLGDTAASVMVTGAVSLYPDGSQLVDVVLPSSLAQRPAWANDPNHLDTRLALIAVSASGEFERLVSYGPRDDCGMAMSYAYMLCGRLTVGIDPTAEHIAWGTMSYAGPDSGTYRITMLNRRGTTIYSRKYPFTAQTIPAHIRDSLNERARTQKLPVMPTPLGPRFGPPTIYPGLETVLVGTDGSAWAQLRPTDAGIPWVMLSPRGDVTGTLTVPANVKLMVVGRGVVWGTEKDADDVESVVRFRVARAKGR
ncbi:MAG TPA: hypothetical protein VGM77_05405 [Gemmatimonadales bacterium]|jgi:hypothetical protein